MYDTDEAGCPTCNPELLQTAALEVTNMPDLTSRVLAACDTFDKLVRTMKSRGKASSSKAAK